MTDTLNTKALRQLEAGGKVLLSIRKGNLPKALGGDVPVGFSSIFWNTMWTDGQPPHTLGILCSPQHPALKLFPTQYYSEYQWWDAMSHSNAVELTKIAPQAQPIVRVIDDWFENRPLALLFEVSVGRGKLLVSGIDFWQDMKNRTAGRQLLRSLLNYMNSDAFAPRQSVDVQTISQL
jgi:hypothetical protein